MSLSSGSSQLDEWVQVDVGEDEAGADGAPAHDAHEAVAGLRVDVAVERPMVSASEGRLRAVLSVLAPPAGQDGRRAPLRLVAVLDRSGSMHGEKIRLVKETVVFMLKKLQATDALGIVDYGSNYHELCPLTLCDEAGKAYLEKAVKSLQVGGQTNLSGGLLMGLGCHASQPTTVRAPASREAAAAGPPDAPPAELEDSREVVRSTFLFTDGLANVGMQRTEDVRQAVRGKLGELATRGSSINTFGFGTDHDAEMLKGIADAGEGTYTHVQGEDNIGEAFGAALGGLISTTHQHVQLSLRLADGVRFADPAFFTRLRVGRLDRAAGSATVEVGDLFVEERRDVLVELLLDEARGEGAGETEQAVAALEAAGFSVILKRTELRRTEARVARRGEAGGAGRGAATDPADPLEGAHELVAREWNRHLFNEAMAKSTGEAEKGDVGRARQTLERAGMAIGASALARARDAVSRSLVQDLGDCVRELGTADSFAKSGSKTMYMMQQAHAKQRSPNGVDFGLNYTTVAQTSMRAEFKQNVSVRAAPRAISAE